MGVKFGRQNIIIARHALKRVSENRLTLAIRSSRIKKIYTEIKRALNQTIHTRLIDTRLLTHLRRPTAANTHNRNLQTRASQYAIFHSTSFRYVSNIGYRNIPRHYFNQCHLDKSHMQKYIRTKFLQGRAMIPETHTQS